MRKLQISLTTIFAVLAFGTAIASSAFAVESPQFLVGGATIALGAEVHVEILAEGNKLELEDMGVGTAISCTPEGLSFFLSNGAGVMETFSCSGGTVTKGTCGSPEMVALNLPWTLQLEQTGTEFESTMKTSVTEGAGWLIECTVLGVKVDDSCTTQNRKVLLTNESTGLIKATFAPTVASEFTNCSVGGKEEGLTNGFFFLHALGTESEELATLAVSLATEVS